MNSYPVLLMSINASCDRHFLSSLRIFVNICLIYPGLDWYLTVKAFLYELSYEQSTVGFMKRVC